MNFLILLMGLMSSIALAAENIAVIVNKKSPITEMSERQVRILFLGDTRFPVLGVPLDLHDRDKSSAIFKDFYAGIASMTPKQATAHWTRKVYTGESSPPKRINGNDAAVIEAIKKEPDAINYIYEKNVTAAVKVVYVLRPK